MNKKGPKIQTSVAHSSVFSVFLRKLGVLILEIRTKSGEFYDIYLTPFSACINLHV